MRKIGILLLGLFVAVCFGACSVRKSPAAAGQPTSLKVTGTITYVEKIALSPDSLVEVQLLDISKQDAPADLIGEQTIVNPGQVPIRFSVDYDPARIVATHTYGIQAKISTAGELQWINTTAVPVITNGKPTKVEVVVQPAK